MSERPPSGVGKLAGTLLGIAVAQRADAQRFARGRTYQRQGAVVEIDVEPGRVTGTVQGSRSEAYVIEVTARRASTSAARPPIESPQRYTALVPDPDDLRFACTCPDWDDPCKHAVAVVVELGERVALDPRLLERWRGVGDPSDDPSSVGDIAPPTPASRRAATASPLPTAAKEIDALHRRELDEFFACPVPPPPPPPVTALPLPTRRWELPWTEVLVDALTALTRDGTRT